MRAICCDACGAYGWDESNFLSITVPSFYGRDAREKHYCKDNYTRDTPSCAIQILEALASVEREARASRQLRLSQQED